MKQLIAGLIMALLNIGLYAHEKGAQPEANSIVHFGASYTRSHIKPNALPDFDGNMGGVQGMYQYRPLNSFYGAVGGFWRYGNNSGGKGSRGLMDAGAHERIGYTFALCNCHLLLTPYTGFGYRHMTHHVKPNRGENLWLYYNQFFFPVGLQSVYDIYNWFSVGFNVVWMPQIFSTVTFDVVDGARFVIRNTFKNFKTSLPLYFHIPQVAYLSVVLSPFFELWQDGRSTAVTQFDDSLGIPKNTYIFWGIGLNIQYAF